jgi:uncharacterized protein
MTLKTDRFGLGNDKFSHAQIASTLSNRFQQLIILPTERCNFRCTYCYEDFLIGKMKEPVQASIERFMDRRVPELAELSLHWFGGEPLLAKQVVLRLSAHANRLCKEHGVSLIGGLTTNAYVLTPDLFEELLTYEQRFFQITFDGWQDGHDAVRKMANGRGSFDRIWENVCATKRSTRQFKVQIRIHVRRDNHENLEVLLDNLAREIGGDPRYSLDFEHLRNLGGPGGKSVDRPLSLTELREVEVGLRNRYDVAIASQRSAFSTPARVAGPVGGAPIGEVSNQPPGTPPYICYAAKPNSLLIRADGRLGKCTVALDDHRNSIGGINPDGTITIDNEQLRPWLRGLSDLNAGSLGCPLAGLPAISARNMQTSRSSNS